MSKIVDIRFPFMGMSLDKDLRYLEIGDTRENYNVRSSFSEEGMGGDSENMMGNTNKVMVLPAGNNKVIGVGNDYENNAVFYLVYNDATNHSIIRYNIDTDTFDKILYGESLLNFQKDKKINHVVILDGLLIWSDGYFGSYEDSNFNPPQKINIEKAFKYTNGITGTVVDKYTTLNKQILDFIKYPPLYPIPVEYGQDVSYNKNNLRGQLFQFRYRYVYDDNEKSVWSTISKIPLPHNEMKTSSIFDEDLSIDNFIQLSIETGVDYVSSIDIAVRYGNIGHWHHFKTLEKYYESLNYFAVIECTYASAKIVTVDVQSLKRIYVGMGIYSDYYPPDTVVSNIDFATRTVTFNNNNSFVFATIDINFYIPSDTTIEYRYYNDIVAYVLDQDDVNRPYDYVPQIANTLELIDKNIICFGNYREGYDNVNINMKFFSELYKSEYPDTYSIKINYTKYFSGDPLFPCAHGAIGFEFKIDQIYENGKYIISWMGTDYNIYKIEYLTQPTDSLVDIQNALVALIQGENFASAILPGNWITLCQGSATSTGIDAVLSANIFIISRNLGKASFKFGANHEFGIHYPERADRTGAVNRGDDTLLYIPFYTEDESSIKGQVVDGNYGNIVKYEIHHIPPMSATHYQIVYSGNTTVDYFLQMRVFAIDPPAANNEAMKIDINSTVLDLIAFTPATVIQAYVWQKGDRIRFICNKVASTPKTDYRYFNEYIDLEIMSQSETDGKITLSGEFEADLEIGTIVEIYRPKKSLPDDSNSRIFYEIGECYPILNPHTANRFHSAGYDNGDDYAQDQSASQPAKGILMAGDTYTKQRNMGSVVGFPVEDYNYNEYYASDSWNRGRIGIVDENMESRQYKAHLRHGGRYFDNTGINDLAVFKYDDYTSLSETWG
ncbi:hypothetical protein KKH23_06425, partial [Patescibacteria group bacterium]|nr:hypothetical protein [Patescibacteria group bacterium]